MNVHLGKAFDDFVVSLIATGEYQSQSEVLREGLRLLKEREELKRLRLEALRKEIGLGIEDAEQGRTTSFSDRTLKRRFEEIKRRGRKRLAGGARKNSR